jgi:hypothetical protein
VFADHANFQWAPIKRAAGASEKLLGVFTERRTQARLLRLAAGEGYEVAGRSVYFVLSGCGEMEGKPLKKFTTVFLDTDESGQLHAREIMQLLHYGLPDLSDMTAAHAGVAAQAAE